MLTSKDTERCAIIIQARMSSCRFPGKMMCKLSNMPLAEYIYRRCAQSSVKKIIVATSDDKSDDILYDHCEQNKIAVIRGSLDNVLKRYIDTAIYLGADYIVRVNGDTPFVDISLIDKFLEVLISEKLEYVSLDRKGKSSPFFSEAVTLQALEKSASLTDDKQDLEHVTKFILDNRDRFSIRFLDTALSAALPKDIRLTIDYPEDIETANTIIPKLKNKFCFTSKEILDVVREKFLLKN